MIRSMFWPLFLVALPFLLYWGYLTFASRMRAEHGGSWNEAPLIRLLAAGVVLMLIGLFIFGDRQGSAPGSVYIPAHEENGKLVPGKLLPPPGQG